MRKKNNTIVLIEHKIRTQNNNITQLSTYRNTNKTKEYGANSL